MVNFKRKMFSKIFHIQRDRLRLLDPDLPLSPEGLLSLLESPLSLLSLLSLLSRDLDLDLDLDLLLSRLSLLDLDLLYLSLDLDRLLLLLLLLSLYRPPLGLPGSMVILRSRPS